MIQIALAMEMEEMLLRGVTTIRDAGGNTFALKKAIDDGFIPDKTLFEIDKAVNKSNIILY